ncbi:hypothetical protein PSV08DRAFT_367897 [Bipolaris maydis]|nr:hypothetical protein PSV08DRAFT_367897 [Bipolaris maydis]
MHRDAICNLLELLSYPSQSRDLHQAVYITSSGEERTPFHTYVSPTFSIFSQLPVEIQLHIVAMCSVSTLFQLMHTSSKLRREASKLFWGQKATYFLIEAEWLIDKAYPGQSFWDMAFLANVQNVEVEYQPVISKKICIHEHGTLVLRHDLINTFWDALKHWCPNLQKVILNQSKGSYSLEDDNEPFPRALQCLLQACPPSIKCSLLYLEQKPQSATGILQWRTDPWQRCLFQYTDDRGWLKTEPQRMRRTILVPPKQFKGPVGHYMGLRYQAHKKIPLQRLGLWPLTVEALDCYHFDGVRDKPFSCPLSGCTAYFSQGGEWSVHAVEVHYREQKKLLEVLPSNRIGAELRERSQALDRKTKQIQEEFTMIREAWVAGDETAQEEIWQLWMEQLHHDAAWEAQETGMKSTLWADFMQDVYMVTE